MYRLFHRTTTDFFVKIHSILKFTGSTPSAVSLAWLLVQPVITAPMIGANPVEQLQQNLTALEITLTSHQLAQLDEVSNWQEARGDS
jgi:aryl-alcohol dehydrogenase-like predicted oxidoreductase